ncbi:hypothetical protein K435DRAFT_649873 [Dendrothele bispora CBS 962.96]|uniref:Uncharacterized protein n=1 Tax=Dendrothele bispora (strain CBS 962.96) TaxID=1314807 RepID=A0A4S8MN58_DENBC|nr:hypothetical protein K435DRAFT_649873 [Dendrothele bispora CBS 962.96]
MLHPVNTPHNPVCFANTIGIVMKCKMFTLILPQPSHKQPAMIYEEAFHITDLRTQLKPIIQRWEQKKEL